MICRAKELLKSHKGQLIGREILVEEYIESSLLGTIPGGLATIIDIEKDDEEFAFVVRIPHNTKTTEIGIFNEEDVWLVERV
jgi:hypothetical protein